jgi:hypothetical protein
VPTAPLALAALVITGVWTVPPLNVIPTPRVPAPPALYAIGINPELLFVVGVPEIKPVLVLTLSHDGPIIA